MLDTIQQYHIYDEDTNAFYRNRKKQIAKIQLIFDIIYNPESYV